MNRKLAWMGAYFVFAQFATAWKPLSAIMLLGAGFAALWEWKQGNPRRAGFPFVLVLIMGLSILWQRDYTARSWEKIRLWEDDAVTATVTVRSAQPAYEGYSYGILHLEEIEGKPVNFNITCYGFPETAPGESFRGEFQLAALEPDDYDNWADGVLGEGEYRGGYESLGPGPGILAWFGRLQQRLVNNLSRFMPSQAMGVASAMILGDKSGLDRETRTSFARAGCSHILVVSGLHLTLLCQSVAGVFRLGRFSKARILVSIAIALSMMGLVGLTPSVNRSALTLILCSAGYLTFQKPDSLTLLALAGMLLSIRNPYAAYDIGFQLSFAATYCVIFAGWLRPRIARLPELPGKYRERRLYMQGRNLAVQILDSFFAGMVAALGTLPLLLFHRMSVSAASPFSSVLATLLGPWILGLGMGLSLLTLLPGTAFLSVPLGWGVGGLVTILTKSVEWLAGLGIARLSLPREYSIYALAVLAVMVWAMVKWGHLKQLPFGAALVLGTACLVGSIMGRNVVEIQLAGTAGYPVVVLTQNGESAVLFRGGNANRSALTRTLEAEGFDHPGLLMDLRIDPSTQPPEAEKILSAWELPDGTTGTLLESVSYYLVREEDGIILLLDIAGRRAAVTVGTLEENREIPVDLYLAGSKLVGQIRPQTILAVGTKQSWLNQTEIPVYTGTYPSAALRPGGGIQIKGGTLYDTQ